MPTAIRAVRARRGHTPDRAENIENRIGRGQGERRPRTDTERCAGPRKSPAIATSAERHRAREVTLHPRLEFGQRKWLDQIVVGSQAETL